MKTEDIGISENEYLTRKLAYFLNYELSAFIFFILSFVYRLTIFLAVLAAVIFTPFLIYVLFKTKKFGWLSTFVLFILIPPITFLTVGIEPIYLTILLLIDLGAFYSYCFVLRFAVYDWFEGIKWSTLLKEQRRKSRLEKFIFKRRLEKKNDA